MNENEWTQLLAMRDMLIERMEQHREQRNFCMDHNFRLEQISNSRIVETLELVIADFDTMMREMEVGE